MVLDRHLARFKHAVETGELIMAGRTMEPGDKTFGIAVFEAQMKEPRESSWRAIPLSSLD